MGTSISPHKPEHKASSASLAAVHSPHFFKTMVDRIPKHLVRSRCPSPPPEDDESGFSPLPTIVNFASSEDLLMDDSSSISSQSTDSMPPHVSNMDRDGDHDYDNEPRIVKPIAVRPREWLKTYTSPRVVVVSSTVRNYGHMAELPLVRARSSGF